MANLASFIALIQLASCLTFGKYNSSLDPGRIAWPKHTWFNNPIELTQTDTGSTVTLTVHFRPTTTLTGATVQIIFPSTYSTEPAKTVTLSTSYNLKSGKDASATYSTTLPSAGLYGPFGIVTRHSQTGQIVDANYNFGCIVVTNSVSASFLTVSRAASSTITTINTDNTLEFYFTLTFSLWAHDIIEIVPDSNWVLKTGPICKSIGDQNPLIGPDNTNISDLPCSLGLKSSASTGVATGVDSDVASDSIYIYGIASDAYVSSGSNSNSYIIKLEVSSITSPAFVTSSSSWIVNIWRFGTNRLLAKYATSSGPGSTAGSAYFTSWESQNYPSNSIVVGQVLYTKVKVETSNPLPTYSILVVTFSSVDIFNTAWWSDLDGSTLRAKGLCYVTPFIDGASCVATDATTATVTFMKAQAKGSVSFVVLSYFSGLTPQVSKITTYYTPSASIIVDQSANNPGLFIIKATSSTVYKIPDVALHALGYWTVQYPKLIPVNNIIPYYISSSNDQNQAGVKGKDIFIRVTPGSSNTWGGASGVAASLIFYFNRVSSVSFNNFNSVYIDSFGVTANCYINTATDLESSTAADRNLDAASPTITPGTSTSNQVFIAFSSDSAAVAPGSYLIVRFTGLDKTSLPYVASNKGTFYEIWAKAFYSTTTEIGSSVISVLPQTPWAARFYTLPLCKDQLDGIPIVNYFQPVNFDYDFSAQSYAIDIEIDQGYSSTSGFMGTGIMATNDAGTLTLGTHFLSTASSPTATFAVSGNQLTITLKGLGSTSVSESSTVKTYLPSAISTLGQTNLNLNTYFYYTKSSDPSLRQVLYQNTWTTWTINTILQNFDSASIGAAQTSGSSWSVGTVQSVTISQLIQISGYSIFNGDYIGLSLPKGYTFSTASIFSAATNGGAFENSPPSSTYYINSSSDTGNGGFIMAYDTHSAWGSLMASSSSTIGFNLAVSNVQPPNYSIESGNSIFGVWVSSDIGANCRYSQAYSGTKSTVIISPIASFSALYSLSGSILVATLTSDLKAGSYNVVAAGVMPPVNPGPDSIDKDCFTALSTKTSSGNVIETWDTSNEASYQTSIASSSSVTIGTSTLIVNT
ncbi:unnamed protein product [Blepharisma stoltei]|uniref:Uncharacterized protein n=1 Tax=Blepharisma stoltei TaxID=1481888 RepID=A0AAU9JVT0_9CILI|nr:unnamed protein product [Blepharisma stoltei]